jgi:diadenosine tetraphosphate (Ap4A) HIT family hydrolase
MRSIITRVAFRFRGSAAAGLAIRQAFARGSRVLPVHRVAETPHVLAFHHPVPGFEPVHLLLVPKLSVPTVTDLSDDRREQIATEVEELAHDCAGRLGFVESRFLVIVNGGTRQDVRQVHFHLVTAGYELVSAPEEPAAGVWTDIADSAHRVHQVRTGDRPVLAGLVRAAETRDSLELDRQGYSIVWDARIPPSDAVVHLTAGMPARVP